MEKDEFFLKRIRELANLSWQRDIVTFSDFLNLNEQNIVSSLKHQFPQIVMETSGGYENAERQMVAFHPDALAFTWEYPIDCLRIEPKALKFSEELSHRDYLGALLNLGVDRSVIGDIEGGQVFVNGKLITSNGYEPKDGDIISVRGKGRFIFDGVSHQTKKGRCSVRIMRYV